MGQRAFDISDRIQIHIKQQQTSQRHLRYFIPILLGATNSHLYLFFKIFSKNNNIRISQHTHIKKNLLDERSLVGIQDFWKVHTCSVHHNIAAIKANEQHDRCVLFNETTSWKEAQCSFHNSLLWVIQLSLRWLAFYTRI